MVPVHNAPELVRRCIDSMLAHVGEQLGALVVVDDASAAETVAMLASLPHPKLRVVRTEEDLGFSEDTDLSRRMLRTGSWLGVHPDTALHHETHGSFWLRPARRPVLEANRLLGHERWPAARRLRKKRRDPFMRFPELWLSADAPRFSASMPRAVARSAAIETRLWES